MASTVVSSAAAPKPNSQSYANSPLQNKPSDDNSNDTSEKKVSTNVAILKLLKIYKTSSSYWLLPLTRDKKHPWA